MRVKEFSRIGVLIFSFTCLQIFLMTAYTNRVESASPQYGGVLKIIHTSTPPGPKIDDAWALRGGLTAIEPALESLLVTDSEGKNHPELATSWEVAPDRSTVTITLRKGVKFHDGSDFNADVAAWNLQKRKDGHVNFTKGWENIEVIDNYTLRINLKTYKNYMIDDFSGRNTAMISRASYEKKGEKWMGENMVGTGPFVFESYKPDQIARFKRNDNYWAKGLPYLDAVDLLYIKDRMTQQAALQAGEVDGLASENVRMVADLRDKGFELESDETGVVAMIPDSKNPDSPFSKKAVREAISIAIDREAIVKARGFGFWSPTQQHARKGHPGYVPGMERQYDPEKAKRLLKEAGYPNGFETRLIPHPTGTDTDVFVAIQSYLEAINVNARIEKVTNSKFTDYRFNGWHNGLIAHPIGVHPNMNQWYEYYHLPSARMNWPVMERPEGFQELLSKSVSTTLPDKDLMQKCGKLLFDDVTIIPLHTTGRSFIHRKEVHDTGFMKWSHWMKWTPDRAWKSK